MCLPARYGALNAGSMVHVVVAGAGIGGLAAALALAASGARVTVLERRSALAEYGAGLQLSPNATRVLAGLGLLDQLRPIALEPRAVRVRRGRDGADVVRFPLGDHATARYGAPFLLVLRPDLQRVLAEQAATRTTVELRLGVDVRAAEFDALNTVAVETSAGRVMSDGFVDARGVAAAQARRSGRSAWRALVPAAGLSPEHLRPETNLWLGRRAHLVHYPVPGGARVNVVAVAEDGRGGDDAGPDLWSQPGDPNRLRRSFVGWHADALQLLDAQVEWRRWPLLVAAPLTCWTRGPLTRLGDAAHPMLPFLAQGASQAIEDAGCLASSLRTNAEVPVAFARYQAERHTRATKVQEASRRQADIYHLGRPASDARDMALRILGGPRALARLDWLYGAG